ncbi:MAG TPA: FtsX-like permease family protein [Motilibacteraceae bacterium]|nr:FtsX-like permease family protein [Motilibacteraceae bacterium]
MYPELLPPLVVGCAVAAGFVLFLVLRRPVLRRLAVRQVVRRPTEAMLVLLGASLGTALLVASLVVGDSLNRSVQQVAFDSLGPVDEAVRAPSAVLGADAARRLAPLRADPAVDGVQVMSGAPAAATSAAGGKRRAEPRSIVWETGYPAAARFGAPTPSGLSIADPGRGGVVLNQRLADALDVGAGSRVTLFAYGTPLPLTVRQVVPAEGLAGFGTGATVNLDAFVSPGTLAPLAAAAAQPLPTQVLVSNAGGVLAGEDGTDAVTAKVRDLLGPLTRQGVEVTQPKHDVLEAARATGDQMGSVFLMIASFSIIAALVLLVMIFVMLAEERRGQLGILRAVGMRRRRVAGAFAVEGAIYAVAAAAVGGLLGVGIGRVVVALALDIMNQWETGGGLSFHFSATPVSLANGMLAGALAAFLAVVLTSMRISRQNIIAAIRDLEPPRRPRPRRWLLVASAVGTVVFGTAAVPAVANSSGAACYLLPALAAVSALPLLRRVVRPRVADTTVALAVLLWGLTANVFRPHVFDDSTTGTYVVLGSLVSFAAVVLESMHQDLLLRPLRPAIARPGERGLALRLAVTYPTARRFRTGSMLAMYCMVVLVVVLLVEISALIDTGLTSSVRSATAGWTLRVDHDPAAPLPGGTAALTTGPFAGRVTEAAPLTTVTANGNDPAGRTTQPVPVEVVGVGEEFAGSAPEVDRAIPSLSDPQQAWELVLRYPQYVLVDEIYGSPGGPQGKTVQPGEQLTLTDPRTGRATTRTIAGVLRDGSAFYGMAQDLRFPVIMSDVSARATYGPSAAEEGSALLRTAPGVDVADLGAQLQGRYLAQGLVATDLAQAVRDSFSATRQLFRLMQGYLMLGLFVGIVGLGVVMVRSVRERRRTIGVLRALGLRAPTVRRSFLTESTFVAAEGVLIGSVLGVITTYLLYEHSSTFGTLDVTFPIAWTQIVLTVVGTVVASLLVTIGPARRAAAIKPAIAVRVAD